MNPTDKATVRPWVFKNLPTSIGRCFKIGSQEQVDGPHGAICIYDDATSLNPRQAGQAEADAQLIVQAVNEYAALNAVAVAAKDYWNGTTGGEKTCGHEFNCVCPGNALRGALSTLATLRAKEGK